MSPDTGGKPGAAFPIVRAVGAQLAGGIAVIGASVVAQNAGQSLPVWGLCGLWGVCAAVMSQILGLRRWWLPVQAVAPVLVWVFLQAGLPNWLFAVVFVLLLGVYWNAVGEGVPLYLSNRTTWRALEGLLPEQAGARVIDLGSGLGGALFWLSKARPDLRFAGVETAPLVFAAARLRQMLSPRQNLGIRMQSIWRTDLSQFDFVYCFLSPVPMPALFAKAQREMPEGAVLVSNTFEVPDHPPDEVMELEDSRRTRLLVWHMDRHREEPVSPLGSPPELP